MQFLKTFLVVLLMLIPVPTLAYDILVLQSMHEKGYDEAVKGFRRECRASIRKLVLSDYAEADITRITREEHPKLIVAVGDRALELALKQKGTPVLYMMALNTQALNAKPRSGVTGVKMLLDPAKYLSVFEAMGTVRVGVVYNSTSSGFYLKRAQTANRNRVELVLREVHAAKETPAMLESLRGKVDAIWMLPDPIAVSPASTEAYFLFSQGERVPVVSFADFYLSMGGAVALTIDRYDIGRQLGEMAQSVLDGKEVDDIPAEHPRRALTKTNDGVVRQLKLSSAAGR